MGAKYFDWNKDKNDVLTAEREISFEDVVLAIETGGLLDIIEHPNQKKYLSQKIFVVNIGNYVYLVPFVEDDKRYFLKTIFPSRKMTKKYILERK